MALYEKELSFKTHVVDIGKGEQYQPWFLEINPRGEVPVLKDGVKIIPDSARIIDYLEDNFSNGDTPRLIPLDQGVDTRQKVSYFREIIDKIPANVVTVGSFYHPDLVHKPRLPFIAPVRAVMKASDMKMSARLRKLAESNLQAKDALLQKAEAHDKNHALVVDRQSYMKLLEEVDTLLTEVEQQLSPNKGSTENWLVYDKFTVADIALTILLERLNNLGLEERFWANGKKPYLAKYFARVRQRESYKRTMPGLMFHIKTLIQGITFSSN
ncbi:hypothetical protein AAG570_013607 [Ranatra chinensis]|uniref:Ganglioside-induced differentiation-associated protein 1 n=1 Tax=Ranatra chinensis TaxID=642074 RepID=A0ABD0YCN9_9HEMI